MLMPIQIEAFWVEQCVLAMNLLWLILIKVLIAMWLDYLQLSNRRPGWVSKVRRATLHSLIDYKGSQRWLPTLKRALSDF